MENLKNKSDEELAIWQAGWKVLNENYILANNEWEKRARARKHQLDLSLLEKQHELNLTIVKEQSKLTKVSISVGFIGVILGAVLGASLPLLLQTEPATVEPESIKEQKQSAATNNSEQSKQIENNEQSKP